MSEHEHEHEHSSLEMAGGCAVGFTGTINGYNADAEARFANALLSVGKWVVAESGCLLGHIKAAIVKEDGSGITLNLTDLENGVEHHGTLGPQEKVKFSFMTAVVDVDEHELKHAMWHAIEDTGLDYVLDEPVCHCHDHDHHHHDGEECCCGHDHDHEHGHEHHHHDGEECCCGHDHGHEHHHHHHDEECECGCGHEHHHHHHDEDECCCGHEHHHHHDDEECEISMTGTFTDVKAADALSIIDSMNEVFDWVHEIHGMLEYIEMTVAPEGHDWVIISVPEKDFACIQGKLPDCPKAFFRLEAVAQDVKKEQLIHRTFHAIEDTDIDCSVNGETHCDCHNPKCSCGCEDGDSCETEKDDCGCGCGHDHEHHDHDHEHHDHEHHDHDGCCCGHDH